MIIWVDAQLAPSIAGWIKVNFDVDAIAIREIGLRDAEDPEIFDAAKHGSAVVMTKDRDFVLLLDQFGPPSQIIWLTCGNTSNSKLKEILSQTLVEAIALLDSGEELVEINATI